MVAQTILSPSPFQTTIWQAGHSYAPGDVVQPTSITNAGVSSPNNPDFVASLVGWTPTGSVTWAAGISFNSNGGAAQIAATTTNQSVTNTNQVAVTVGQKISGYCFGGGNASIGFGDNVFGFCRLVWYDSGHTQISTTDGSPGQLGTIIGNSWTQLTVSGVAPATAAFCALAGVVSVNADAVPVYLDAFYWDYLIPSGSSTTPANNFFFTNISSGIATSAAREPDWSNGGSNAGNVTDGGITWARGIQETIQWLCEHFCQSGNSPPTWVTSAGGFTPDGPGTPSAFTWKCITPQIQDVNCPQSKYVMILSSKIFAGDTDIVRYSATTNPMDWTTTSDAGFLPTGLNVYGANPVTGLGAYRSNLVVFNSQGMEIWQTDEDPANMSLLTAIPIGCSYPKTICPVNDDLFFLASQGVRTVGITAASTNLMAGDVGMPIDALVQAGVAFCVTASTEPIAAYYPSAGQFWIHFPQWNGGSFFYSGNDSPVGPGGATGPSNVFVCTMNKRGEVSGAWSRYNFAFPTIDAMVMLGDVLYLRSGDDVLAVDPTSLYDYQSDSYLGGARQAAFNWVVEWPYIDFGQPGTSKFLGGIDVIGKQTTNVTVSIGYNQADHTLFTTPFKMPGDSLPGLGVPMCLEAPSFAPRLTGVSTDAWEIEAVILYVDDAGAGI